MSNARERFLDGGRFAYFRMEMAFATTTPSDSGGLGMLAGDVLRAAADLQLPYVAVTLARRDGFSRQRLAPDDTQPEELQVWDPAAHCTLLDAVVAVTLTNRRVWAAAWLYVLAASNGGWIPVLLLDPDLPVNAAQDRHVTAQPYGGDSSYRLSQEAILGIGGARLLRALGFRMVHYHLNEGHSALLTVELVRRHGGESATPDSLAAARHTVRRRCTFTTHTPVAAGHDRFAYAEASRILAGSVDEQRLRALAGGDELNLTQLVLNLCGYVNGVAQRHAGNSARLFPSARIHAITNGVHGPTWASPEFNALYDRWSPRWRIEPEVLARADCCLPTAAVLAAHAAAKERLLQRLRRAGGGGWRADALTIGFARLITACKQPTFLFQDLERLRSLADRGPLQLVFAGKAHPRDEEGKALVRDVHAALAGLQPQIPGAFLADFDMTTAQSVLSGVDLWINTPPPPLEASGTSGMKAACNGVPSLSVRDGWWVEGHIEGVTGRAIDGVGPRSMPQAHCPRRIVWCGAMWPRRTRRMVGSRLHNSAARRHGLAAQRCRRTVEIE